MPFMPAAKIAEVPAGTIHEFQVAGKAVALALLRSSIAMWTSATSTEPAGTAGIQPYSTTSHSAVERCSVLPCRA